MIAFLTKDKRLRPLLMGIFVVAALLTITLNMSRGLFTDDDNLWFHLLTYKLIEPDAVTTAENKMIELFAAREASENQVTRLTDKRDYKYNYLASTALWTAGRLLVEAWDSAATYQHRLGHSMVAGFWLATATALLLFLAVCWRLRLPTPWWNAIACLGVFCLLTSVMPGPKPPGFMILNDDFHNGLLQFLYFSADASYGFSAFSFTGRNNYILLMLAFFLARWRGNDAFAYAIMAFAMLWHASMGILLLLTIVMVDLVTRPRVLRQMTIIASIALSLVYYFLVESLWQKVGVQALYLLGAGVVVLMGALWLLPRITLPARLAQAKEWLRTLIATDRAGADVLLIAGGWLLTLPVVVYINNHVDQMQSIYFWSQLHMRVYAVLLPAFLLFGFLRLVGRDAPQPKQVLAACIVACLAMLSLSHMAVNDRFGLYPVKMKNAADFLEAVSTNKTDVQKYGEFDVHMPRKCYMPEAMVYYLLIKEFATGQEAVAPYLAKQPKSLRLDCI